MKWLASTLVLLVACGSDSKPAPAGDDGDPPPDAPPGVCDGVPEGGACNAAGTEVTRCADGAPMTETCETGCVVVGGVASCGGPAVCDGVGPLGRCEGDVLRRCDGAPSVVDCAAGGMICGYRDDTAGYACLASTGAHRVAGTITWEDRPLSPGMLGAPITSPARGTMVAVVDDSTNAQLATVSAADDGTYVAHYAAQSSTRVRVVAYSRSRAELRPARVRDTAGYLHAVGSTAFEAGASSSVDIHVTAASTAGGAWNALDNAITAMDWLRAHGTTPITPVYIYWQSTTASGSYYQGGSNALHLDGDDGFDDVVALHELGHYVQDEYSDSDNPGGAHDGSPADPRLAWGEGGATWFALALRQVPYYIDWSIGGGWSVELEQRVHAASPSGTMSQNVSEWMVAEVLWDITDSATDGADAIDGGAPSVWKVLVGYVISPQRRDRGRAGLDLVEFLDGWFVEHGMASCSSMRALLRTQYGFPYDLAGPAGACP
ncbi:MAG: hypothetical protein H0T46_00510 [Deltaproteobacteria bacterium]|nr:hypothetical protein [Deltaproteobacteria bacterium]